MAPATKEEKLKTGLEHKAAGNTAFGKQDFAEALRCYHLAILFLSGLESESAGVLGLLGGEPDASSSETNAEAKTALGAVHCNMALIYLKQYKYDRAVVAAEKSLKSSEAASTAVKAKYRKAQALRLSGEVHKARDYIGDLLETAHEADERAALQSELKLTQQAIDARYTQSRNQWKGFLSKKPRVLDATNAQPAEPPSKA